MEKQQILWKKMLAVFVEVGEKETTFGKRNIFQFIKAGIG